MLKNTIILLILSIEIFAQSTPKYVGDKVCKSCHQKEFNEWEGSHHDMAMKLPTSKTVVGDFNSSSFELNGVRSSFYKRDDKFYIKTDGEDGKLHEFEVAYTFGIYPLQQYLLKFPNGKYQIPDIAWDARAKKDGGQRWYHIHQNEVIKSGDVLHWSGPNLNWNYMCADCHSTNLKKNYNAKTKEYHTTFDSINVSCEACHAPASNHILWTKDNNISNRGFSSHISKTNEIETCAKCHSRRSQLDDNFVAGDRFDDHYLAAQLEESLYFADGKIEDEVYVYDSFIQSKMYANGVTCSDCHNPHSLKRKKAGDGVCFGCHTEEKYTASLHHKHQKGSVGASCVSCHMPPRLYMGVDSRNDHSFRIPRPDISVDMPEIPNACNLCHKDKSAKWSADHMKKWYGKTPKGKQNFAHQLQSLRTNQKEAPKDLYSVLMSDAPDIAKATVTKYLGNYPSKQTYTTTLQLLKHNDSQIRRSALQSLEKFPPELRIKKVFEMLSDESKIVRMEATRQLSSFSTKDLDKHYKDILEKAFKEYEEILLYNAERPEYQLSLAIFYSNRKMNEKAIKAYKEAINLQSQFVPTYINYSNLLLSKGKSKEALEILQQGIKSVPNIAILHHSLGLWYVRNKQNDLAIKELKRAVELDSNNARFSYVYAVAIAKNDMKSAIVILENIYKKHTGNKEIVAGLRYYYNEIGNTAKSVEYNKKLDDLEGVRLYPLNISNI